MQALDELKGVDSVSEVLLKIVQPLVEPLIEARLGSYKAADSFA